MRVSTLAAASAVAFLALAGCRGEPRIDGTSVTSFETTVAQIGQALPEDQRPEWATAVAKILADEFGDPARTADRLDGMTAAQVIREAESVELSPFTAEALEAAERAAARAR